MRLLALHRANRPSARRSRTARARPRSSRRRRGSLGAAAAASPAARRRVCARCALLGPWSGSGSLAARAARSRAADPIGVAGGRPAHRGGAAGVGVARAHRPGSAGASAARLCKNARLPPLGDRCPAAARAPCGRGRRSRPSRARPRRFWRAAGGRAAWQRRRAASCAPGAPVGKVRASEHLHRYLMVEWRACGACGWPTVATARVLPPRRGRVRAGAAAMRAGRGGARGAVGACVAHLAVARPLGGGAVVERRRHAVHDAIDDDGGSARGAVPSPPRYEESNPDPWWLLCRQRGPANES